MMVDFSNLKSVLFNLVYICIPLVSFINKDFKSDIIKKDKYTAIVLYPIFILAYLALRLLLGYTIYFMMGFLDYSFEEQKPIAILSFTIIDTLYWILAGSIIKRSKQIIIYKYIVAFGIESIVMLPFSMILASFAMSFAFL